MLLRDCFERNEQEAIALAKGGYSGREEKKSKGVWGMPRLLEAKKDVISCEKLRGEAHTQRSADVRMGQPGSMQYYHPE